MVNPVSRYLKRLQKRIEKEVETLNEEYAVAKKDECRSLYNDMMSVLQEHKATSQNVLFVLKMIEWSYLRAEYLQNVEKTVVVPNGSVPLKEM